MEKKRLYRSMTDKKISGVCGGISTYLDVDSTVIRLVWALACFASVGVGVLAYIAASLIIPAEPMV